MRALVGYTGFVGSNLYRYGEFDRGFNSRNIEEAYGLGPELLVYAGVRAEKYLANEYPDRDRAAVVQAQENIDRIAPKKLVLISTIDVLGETASADEDTPVETNGLQPYGQHRYLLEKWVREQYQDALIIRLPALFGIHLKKNFIYDYIQKIPFKLKKGKMEELCALCPEIGDYYAISEDGYYQCRTLASAEKIVLKRLLDQVSFNALYFTDSRNSYQFYPLDRLWGDMQTALANGLTLWHPATEPITAGKLYYELEGREFHNEILERPVNYHFVTKYAELFGGSGGYICESRQIVEKIRKFVKQYAEG